VLSPSPEPQPDAVALPSRPVPAERVGAAMEVLLCSGFPTQILLIGVLTAVGLNLRPDDSLASPAFVFTLSLLDTVLVVGLVFLFLIIHGESPRAVLLGDRPVLHEILAGIALFPIVFVVAVLLLGAILTLAPRLHNVPVNPLENMLQNREDAAMFAFVVMVAGGLREEIQRGFILHRFERFLGGGATGVVVYSGLFGLGHIYQGWDASLTVAVLGALWGSIYLIRRSIIAPMVSHAGFNLAQLVKYIAMH
jgi:membrane protease YdiL (CAAX protease family)